MRGGKPQLLVVGDAGAAAAVTADLIFDAIGRAAAERGRAEIVLAGGRTPAQCYQLLAGMPIPWERVTLWLSDERCVPPGDPEANGTLVAKWLIGSLPMGSPLPEVVPVPGAAGPEAAAASLSAELIARLGAGPEGPPAFDLALLGLGEDGHTASLFPGAPALMDRGLFVPVHGAPKPPPDRVSMTVDLLAAARARVILATGTAKAAAVAALMDAPDPTAPASLLPAAGTTVVADEPAAAAATGVPAV